MAEGDVIIQVDRQAAGWALDVDDDALAVMNKVASPHPGSDARRQGSVQSSYETG